MEEPRKVFNNMLNEHTTEICYLHAFGEGTRFGIIYVTHEDETYAVGYNGDFNLLGPSGPNFLKKRLEKPVKIERLSGKGIKKISVGDQLALGLGAYGLVYQWGLPVGHSRSSYDKSSIKLPHPLTSCVHVVTRLDCGGGFFAVLTNHKKVFMWGYIDWSAPFSDGRLFSPIHKEVISLSCGAWHIVMLAADGKVYTYGHGGYGQLGYDWSEGDGYWRVKKMAFSWPCSKATAGSVTTMCVSESGELWACGLNHAQFGYLGVDSEESVIKNPIKVNIHEPVASIACSFTLCTLRNVYAATCRDMNKIYVWGWRCQSKWPRCFQNGHSLYDVFYSLATPSNIGDIFSYRDFEDDSRSEESFCSVAAENHSSEKLEPARSSSASIQELEVDIEECKTYSQNSAKPVLNFYNNLKPTSVDKTRGISENNRCSSISTFKPPTNNQRCDTPHKIYLDYVYSGGNLELKFTELLDVHILATHYEEAQLIDCTANQIEARLGRSNFSHLLSRVQVHKTERLTAICDKYIADLCAKPSQVVELIMSLSASNR